MIVDKNTTLHAEICEKYLPINGNILGNFAKEFHFCIFIFSTQIKLNRMLIRRINILK